MNEMISNPDLLPRMDEDPPFPNTGASRARTSEQRIPNPTEEFYGCRILGVKTVGGTIEAEMSSGDDQPVTSRGEHWTSLAPS